MTTLRGLIRPVDGTTTGASGALSALTRTPRRLVTAGATVFVVLVGAMWLWWPLGVALGLVIGVVAVLLTGRVMTSAATAEPADGLAALTEGVDLPAEFQRLRHRVGEDWADFSRAAVLVTGAQWASAAGLQRELRVSFAHAQHLLLLLEQEGFVGPSRGSRARVVLLARDRKGELQQLLH